MHFLTVHINPRSLRSWYIKGTKELTLPRVDFSVPLTHYDPSDLGLICLKKKRKICFPIISDLRIQCYIFSKKCTLNWQHYMGKPTKWQTWRFTDFKLVSLLFFSVFVTSSLYSFSCTLYTNFQGSSFEHDVVIRLFVWGNH